MLNGTSAPAVTGAKDIDFGFSPATFTLPIRRLKLAVGDKAEVLVARLHLENKLLKPLQLIIRRTAKNEYEWLETETGTTSHLLVDAQGIVQVHKGHWISQA